uniref:Hydroxy-delta-5-steroid dehydrogenase, 3 beta- and steroid delta-isomerase 7 n=1 Tax=Catharus ustulatus TaxID=91951 RepID=A0A8C3U766_CATUS
MVVTGGSGFLGSHLVQVLLEAEPELRELRILDLNPDPAAVPERSRVRLFRGDVGDLAALGAVLGGADVVFHSASLVDVWGNCSAEAMARVNVLGTKNVIRGCRAGGVPVLIYTSSMEVVGPNTRGDPFVRGDEQTPYPTRHSEPYPLSKAQAERLVLEANGSTVRFGGNSGEFGKVGGNVAWMHVLAARAARSRPDSVGGEFFFCTDCSPCDFNILLLGPAGLHFGGPRLPKSLLGLLARLNGALREVLGFLGARFAPLLNPYTWAVASTPFTVRSHKARSRLGYRPLFSWEEARDRTVAWVRQLGGA